MNPSFWILFALKCLLRKVSIFSTDKYNYLFSDNSPQVAPKMSFPKLTEDWRNIDITSIKYLVQGDISALHYEWTEAIFRKTEIKSKTEKLKDRRCGSSNPQFNLVNLSGFFFS